MRLAGVLSLTMLGLVSLAAPAAAADAPLVALAPAPGEDSLVSLAGQRAVIARPGPGPTVQLVTVPVGGGAGRTIFSFRPPRRAKAYWFDFDASSTRVAAIAGARRETRERSSVRTYAWAGTPEGRFARLVPAARVGGTVFAPLGVQAAGGAVALIRARFRPQRFRYTVYPVDGAPRPLSLPEGPLGPQLAGDLVGYASGARELTVTDWRTGARRYRLAFNDTFEGLDLTPDGRSLVLLENGQLWLVDASGQRRRVFTDREQVVHDARLAGDLIILRRDGRTEGDQHLVVLDPRTGSLRQLSPSASAIGSGDRPPDVEGDLVAWTANGCALIARPSGPGALAVPAGPCPRSDIFIPHAQHLRLRGNRARVTLRCLSAPEPGCRGVVSITDFFSRALARQRFLVPPRRTKSVVVRFTRRALRSLDRQEPIVDVVAVASDEKGRRSRATQGLSVILRR
jgi:hypothetical protein